jgi:hypothetical protein
MDAGMEHVGNARGSGGSTAPSGALRSSQDIRQRTRRSSDGDSRNVQWS